MLQDNTYFNRSTAVNDVPQETEVVVSHRVNQQPIKFAISKFQNERSNSPQAVSYSWDEFCKEFASHQIRTTKAGGSCWSPATYKAGATRGNKSVVEITMAVIDVDGGIPVENLINKVSGYTVLIHSSFSHTPDNQKYRVILPLIAPVKAEAWPQTWQRINSWLGNVNDPATKDASRLYFTPSCPAKTADRFVKLGQGNLLDPNALPELPAEQQSRIQSELVSARSHYIEIDGIEAIPPDPLGSEPQLAEMQQRCSFIQWAANPENQPIVPEPLWMSMLSNQCRFEGGSEAAHESSCHHPGYDENQTDRKIERCRTKSGPITCSRIQSHGFNGCPSGGCKLPSGEITKAPAGLGVWASKKNRPVEETAEELPSDGIPNELKKYIHKNHGAGLVFVNGSFYGYQDGYWPMLDEQADMRKSIAKYLGKSATAKDIKELLTLSKDFYSAKEQEVEPNLNLICLANGTLDVENARLIDFSPHHHLASKNDIHWDPSAKCERWHQFLNEIFVNDVDKAQKIAFLKTWFGYCLVPDNTQHKFVWMAGGGGNGKGILLSILTRLVGSSNVSHAYIERLDEKYVRAELQGKLVNISPEMSADATLADGYLKAIVSGDIIEAERKYMPSFSFRPFVRLIGATNHLPRLLDLSDGFFRRAIVLSFNRQFLGNDCDPDLGKKLLEELPGIMVWAVEGLKELRAAGHFTIPQSSIDALAQYRADSDPVGIFAAECLVKDNSKGLPPAEIYSGYRAWCIKSGFSPMNKVNFGKRLGDLGFSKRRSSGKDYWLVQPSEGNEFVWVGSVPVTYEDKANCPEVIAAKQKYPL